MDNKVVKNWCEHIHWWGDDYYFIDTFNPFPVGEKAHTLMHWSTCPICNKPKPKE